MIAARDGLVTIVQILLSAGAVVDSRNYVST